MQAETKERFTALADFIRDHVADDQFDMNVWVALASGSGRMEADEALHHCGTVGCVAGWAMLLFGDPHEEIHSLESQQDEAKELLGLTDGEATHLFFGYFTNRSIEYIDRELAIFYLETAVEEDQLDLFIDDNLYRKWEALAWDHEDYSEYPPSFDRTKCDVMQP